MKNGIPKYEPRAELEMTDASVIAALRACVTGKDALIELYAIDNVKLHLYIQSLVNAFYAPDLHMEEAIEEALAYLNGKDK